MVSHLGSREAERQTVLDLYGEVRALADEHPEEAALLSMAERAKAVLPLLDSEDDMPSLLQALHMIAQAITQPNANPLARSAYALAYASVLSKAAEEGSLADVARDLAPPPPEIALAAQVLILREAGEVDAADAALVDIGRAWPEETVDQVRVLIDGVAKIKAL